MQIYSFIINNYLSQFSTEGKCKIICFSLLLGISDACFKLFNKHLLIRKHSNTIHAFSSSEWLRTGFDVAERN